MVERAGYQGKMFFATPVSNGSPVYRLLRTVDGALALNQTRETTDIPIQGQAYMVRLATTRDFELSITVVMNVADECYKVLRAAFESESGQAMMQFQPEGVNTGTDDYKGTVIITSFNVSTPRDGVAQVECSMSGTGALARTVQ